MSEIPDLNAELGPDNHPGGHSLRAPKEGEDEFEALLNGAVKRVVPEANQEDEAKDSQPPLNKPRGGMSSVW